MPGTDIWKYLSVKECNEFILSFHLLDGLHIPRDKELACLYGISNHVEGHYHKVFIPKRDGTKRKLLAPDFLLKRIQKNILHHILEDMPVSAYATAYHKGGGIALNASVHSSRKGILKLDVTDFFGSILYPMIYQRVFLRTLFPPAAAGLLTHLCCYYDSLPQGAPTSPAISNLVMKPFDEYMGRWCEERGIIYTRYCDDMTFSGDFSPVEVKNKVKGYLYSMGFLLNHKKTRILTPSMRQSVTGIVVNKRPQVSREYRRRLRQEIYYCYKYGVKSHLEHKKLDTYLIMEEEGSRRYLLSLLGKINFILEINPQDSCFTEGKILVREMLDCFTASSL